jgi:hypothetical protein
MFLLYPIFKIAKMVFVMIVKNPIIDFIILSKTLGTYSIGIKRYLLKKRQLRVGKSFAIKSQFLFTILPVSKSVQRLRSMSCNTDFPLSGKFSIIILEEKLSERESSDSYSWGSVLFSSE